MERITSRISLQHLTIAFGLFSLVVIGAAAYGSYRVYELSKQVAYLSSTAAELQASITDATTSLHSALEEERQKVQHVESKVGSIDDTVDDLQKLSQIDPELLAKYSKVFFLSDNYAPARLAEIPAEYRYIESKPLQIIPEVLPYLKRLMRNAKEDDVELYIDSAYRSFHTQEALKEQYKFIYGAGTANQFSADQGYSEHQLGTTVDFITTGLGGALEGFDRTAAYTWLQNNAYKYGFVLSYPPNNGYYIFEPWHWRFVGEDLAKDLFETKKYFYELDQRKIDTYLISLFD